MAGHNKWSKVKRLKGVADSRRAKVFAKLSRELMITARDGGADPDLNPRLRMVLVKCRAANMPMDNVERAIKKGAGGSEGDAFEELVYEVFGPSGVAILVETATDNRNRTTGTIRHLASKHQGSLASSGAVSRLFHRKGQIIVARDGQDEDRLMELALEAGAEDFRADAHGFEILTDPAGFEAVHRRLEEAGVSCEAAEVTFVPETTVPVDPSSAAVLQRLIEGLDDDDDVKDVHTNADYPDEA